MPLTALAPPYVWGGRGDRFSQWWEMGALMGDWFWLWLHLHCPMAQSKLPCSTFSRKLSHGVQEWALGYGVGPRVCEGPWVGCPEFWTRERSFRCILFYSCSCLLLRVSLTFLWHKARSSYKLQGASKASDILSKDKFPFPHCGLPCANSI